MNDDYTGTEFTLVEGGTAKNLNPGINPEIDPDMVGCYEYALEDTLQLPVL